ncbi:hypothetical protein D3C76_1044350 [compost metagenome]
MLVCCLSSPDCHGQRYPGLPLADWLGVCLSDPLLPLSFAAVPVYDTDIGDVHQRKYYPARCGLCGERVLLFADAVSDLLGQTHVGEMVYVGHRAGKGEQATD